MGSNLQIDCGCQEQPINQSITGSRKGTNQFSQKPIVSNFNSITQNNLQYKLFIQLLGSPTMNLDKDIQITPSGINNPKRIKEGYTFFGSQLKNQDGQNGITINDVIIPSIDEEMGKNQRGTHFYIRFDQQKQCYLLKDEGIGFGTFTRIQESTILKNSMLLSTGLLFIIVNTTYGGLEQLNQNTEIQIKAGIVQQFQSHLVNNRMIYYVDTANGFQKYSYDHFIIFIQNNKNQYLAFLQLQFNGAYTKNEQFLFCTNTSFGYIDIGRESSNMIQFQKDTILSKYQCRIKFDGQMGWILEDLQSMNGVWIYVDEEIKITDGMIIKANYSTFKVKYHLDQKN